MNSAKEGSRYLAGGDGSSGMARLQSIRQGLFTRPPNNFVKTGTSGKSTQLVANVVAIEQHDQIVQQYHVEFHPQIDYKVHRHYILKQERLQEEIGDAFIFDGMHLYIAGERDIEGTYTARHPSTNERVVVRIRFSLRFNQNDPQAIICYNIIIRSCMNIVGLKRLGRNHYDEQQKVKLSEYNAELWPGFETAVSNYEDRLMLCIENRFKMIRRHSVWDIMSAEYDRGERNMKLFQAKMDKLFVGETVLARYNYKIYRVTSIDYNMTPSATFRLPEGSVTTIKDYIEKNYNIRVTQPQQPVIISEITAKQPGERNNCVYLLPEFCFLTGITESMRKDYHHMSEVARHTRLNPERRRWHTENLLERIHNNDKCRTLLQKWGIELEEKLTIFQSRELEPEKLMGHEAIWYTGERAEWSRFMRNNVSFRGVHLHSWVVVVPNTTMARNLANLFVEEVKRVGECMRIHVEYPMLQVCRDVTPIGYRNAALEAIQKAGAKTIRMMAILLVDDDKLRYDTIKQWLCSETEIPSQCVQLSTLRGLAQNGRNKNIAAVMVKIVMQMNCKMGGALWKVDIPIKRAMFVGYDLYYDSTLQGQAIGACVSTTDQDYTKFYSQVRPHRNPGELGTNLGRFIKRALYQYYIDNDRTLPVKIFLYRDGVGDGDIPSVKEQEVPLVQQACIEMINNCGLDPSLHPIKLAFVIVTKTGNMRIFKQLRNTRLTNPSPGTIVDSVVTRPERYDFYLIPQYVHQGTVAPVCYNVIHDDTGLRPDQHHRLAYKLSHLYYNWQGTVRVPAPCQYAHKLAFMVSQNIHKNVKEELRDKLFFL